MTEQHAFLSPHYLHIADPDSLSDTEWAMRFAELVWIRKEETKGNK
ncbi:MAG: hypothetical protein J6Y55_01950 [Bacteroidales bacterium]|nr:hypothetical protein [Bacteroidales bacterium]